MEKPTTSEEQEKIVVKPINSDRQVEITTAAADEHNVKYESDMSGKSKFFFCRVYNGRNFLA